MFDFKTVMEKVVYASKSEGGYIESYVESPSVFVLRDASCGDYRFIVEPEKVIIDGFGRGISWKYEITSMEELYGFINTVIYDIDPYLE